MPSLRDEAVRGDLIERLRRLTPTTKANWGKFDAPHMICHLSDTLSAGLGNVSAAPLNKPAFQHFPLKHLIIYLFPFPKGAPASPEFLTSSPQDFDTDRMRLISLIERMAATRKTSGATHPLFGPLTNDEWNALQWKHIAHHLKQFGS